MVIAFDAVAHAQADNSASPLTWSHTCTGSNGLLLVGVQSNNSPRLTGITYNGVPMTRITGVQSGNGNWVDIYGLLNPATGSHTVSVSWGAGNNYVRAISASYTGVKQSGLPDASNTYTSTGGGTTIGPVSVTTVADNCWVAVFFYSNGGNTITAGTGAFSRLGVNNASSSEYMWSDTNGVVHPAGSNSQTANLAVASSIEDFAVGISFAPVPTTTTSTTTSTSTSTTTTSTSTSTTTTSTSTSTSTTTTSTSTTTTSTSSSTSTTTTSTSTSTTTTSTSSSTSTTTSTTTTQSITTSTSITTTSTSTTVTTSTSSSTSTTVTTSTSTTTTSTSTTVTTSTSTTTTSTSSSTSTSTSSTTTWPYSGSIYSNMEINMVPTGSISGSNKPNGGNVNVH